MSKKVSKPKPKHVSRGNRSVVLEAKPKRVIRCATYGCQNTSDRGKFVGALCSPCYLFVTTSKGMYSAVFRNAVQLFLQDLAGRAWFWFKQTSIGS